MQITYKRKMNDNSGIDGGSDTARAYVDDVMVGSSTTDLTPSNASSVGQMRIGNSYLDATLSTGYVRGQVDNIKIWDYAKVDFSDRLTEDGD